MEQPRARPSMGRWYMLVLISLMCGLQDGKTLREGGFAESVSQQSKRALVARMLP